MSDNILLNLKVPIRLLSEGNINQHWATKRQRKKENEFLLKAFYNHAGVEVIPPCTVTLCRIAPRELDDDNLRTAFKPIRDWIADRLVPGKAPGRADSDKRIKWEYMQERGKPNEYAIWIIFSAPSANSQT